MGPCQRSVRSSFRCVTHSGGTFRTSLARIQPECSAVFAERERAAATAAPKPLTRDEKLAILRDAIDGILTSNPEWFVDREAIADRLRTMVAELAATPREPYTCPTDGADLRGCGKTFTAEPASDGTVDCPYCGIWFTVTVPKAFA